MLWVHIVAALAAPSTDTYPWSAPVELSPTGIQRIHVPAELHDASSPLGAHNLLLVDGDGERVPIALLEGGKGQTRTRARPSHARDDEAVGIWPEPEANTWTIAIRDRIQERLVVTLDEGTYAITGRLVDPTTNEVLDSSLFWRLDGVHRGSLELPPTVGEWRLELLTTEGRQISPTVFAERTALTHVPDEVVDLQVLSSERQENRWARYDLGLAHPYPLQSVELDIPEDLFDRQAGTTWLDPHTLPGILPSQLRPSTSDRVRRVELGGSKLSSTSLTVSGDGHQLVALIEADNAVPLTVLGAKGRFPGKHLIVRNPGKGPFTLYAGGPGAGATSDLQFAASELARLADRRVEPGAVVPNPTFVAPEDRGGLGRPGRALDLDGFRFQRTVTGDPGLVRIPLDDEVMQHANMDLSDVRLADADGDQIPYVLRSDSLLHTWGELPFEREERGETSILRVPLPKSNVHVGAVTLTTDAPVFRRRVRVARARGPQLQTLRAYDWLGENTAGTLTLAVHQRIGDELIVMIDNGDDPPLPIETIRVDHPGWEVLAQLPPSGQAQLLYGNSSLRSPEYDFELVSPSVSRRARAVADVGPHEKRTPTPLGWLDRVMLTIGIGVMALGLLGLALLLLRGSPEEDEESEDAPPEEAPAPDDLADPPEVDDASGAPADVPQDDDVVSPPPPPPFDAPAD